MPKRPPGVYKRGKTWSVVIDHSRDPATGKCKRVWRSGFTTLSEAAEACTRLLCERDTGAAIDPSRQTLAEYCATSGCRRADRRPLSPAAVIVERSASRRGTPTAVISSGMSSRGLAAWCCRS